MNGQTQEQVQEQVSEQAQVNEQVNGQPQADHQPIAQQAGDRFERQAEQAAILNEQLEAIRALDPDMVSWEAVADTPEAPRIHQLVLCGCTPAEAFRAARFDSLVERRVAAARTAATRRAYGRAHLTATQTARADGAAVPPDVARQYRAFFPDWNEAQIAADYRKRL